MGEWYYKKWPLSGGSPASGFRNQLAGAGMLAEDLFIREVIQNSVDALPKDGLNKKVKIRISLRTLNDAEAKDFLSSMGIDKHELVSSGKIEALENESEFSLMLVEDFNTVGLGGVELAGQEAHKEDNFVRLCRDVGSTTDDDGTRGGSFGYGKSVYWVNSGLWTVAFYSRFKKSNRTNGATRRFISAGWYNEYLDETKRKYTGQAWFGKCTKRDPELHTLPYLDEEADTMAEMFGIPVRANGECGTSILILRSKLVNIESLSKGVEKHWWPRIISKKLEVEFYRNGVLEAVPDPKSNPDLEPYLKAWSEIENDEITSDNGMCLKELKYRNNPLGKIALLTDQIQSTSNDETWCRNSIALVRAPLMVTEYRFCASSINYFGVFYAHDSINSALRDSEPSTHDKWDEDSAKLKSKTDKAVVKNVREKINGERKRFLTSLVPERKKGNDQCKALGALMGKFFKGKTKGPQDSQGGQKRPISISFKEGPVKELHPVTQLSYIYAKVEVRGTDDIEGTVPFEISPKIKAFEDEAAISGNSLGVLIRHPNGKEEDGSILVDITSSFQKCYEITTDPFSDLELKWQFDLEMQALTEE